VRQQRQQAPAQVFTCFVGERPRAQRSITDDLIFGSFHQGKEQSPPAAIERARAHNENTAWRLLEFA